MMSRLLILVFVVLSNCGGESVTGSPDHINCESFYDADLKEFVYVNLETPAYYKEGSLIISRLINSVPSKIQETQYGHVRMSLTINKHGEVVKVTFDDGNSDILEEYLVKLFLNKKGWMSGKCSDNDVVSKLDLRFVW